jgi:hypothetical protein
MYFGNILLGLLSVVLLSGMIQRGCDNGPSIPSLMEWVSLWRARQTRQIGLRPSSNYPPTIHQIKY